MRPYKNIMIIMAIKNLVFFNLDTCQASKVAQFKSICSNPAIRNRVTPTDTVMMLLLLLSSKY